MAYTLTFDSATCICCEKCVHVCPASIFRLQPGAPAIDLYNKENCIQCGQCVAICPIQSIQHSTFPYEKIHPIKMNLLPSPEEVISLIRARRSNRAFSDEPVPERYFDFILEAANRAPTASNLQQVKFTLVTNPQILKQIISLTAEIFSNKIKLLNQPMVNSAIKRLAPTTYRVVSVLNSLTQAIQEGKDPILRGATSLLLIHSPRSSNYGKANCQLAYQNASLMAESLGVSQFYTGFVCRAMEEDKKRKIQNLLEITGNVYAGMGLGMPKFKFKYYMDRNEIPVKRI